MSMRQNGLASIETNALKLVIFIPSVAIIKSKVVILHFKRHNTLEIINLIIQIQNDNSNESGHSVR